MPGTVLVWMNPRGGSIDVFRVDIASGEVVLHHEEADPLAATLLDRQGEPAFQVVTPPCTPTAARARRSPPGSSTTARISRCWTPGSQDEGHGFENEENRLRFCRAVERHLARHLGGRSGTTSDVDAA